MPPSEPNTPAEFPLDFANKKAILVTTFERMFNGRSIFGVDGYGNRPIQEIGAMVIDDAHSCIKKARQQSTIIINNSEPSYDKLLELFSSTIREQGEGAYISIKSGDDSTARMVPYWTWREQKNNVISILQSLYTKDSPITRYTWGLIGDEISKCQCYISGSKIEITPIQIPVERIPSFFNAKHRYILSATFNNNTELITELGIDKEAVETPLTADNQGDIGERLIIAPKRYYPNLDDKQMRSNIVKYAKNYNVVVLVPNTKKAQVWEKEHHATVVNKSNIEEATNILKESNGNLMVFNNRYDGIDLAGDTCRILVLDGLPNVQSVREKYSTIVREGSPFLNAQIAQTIEQGLGRAVRSGSDYCSIFLLDSALLNFIGIDENRNFFESATKKQLDFGLELFSEHTPTTSEEALAEIYSAVEACLTRDSDWRTFHKDMILSTETEDSERGITNQLLNISDKERESLLKFREDDAEQSTEMIRDLLNKNDDYLNDTDKSWYLQLGANILDSINPVEASDMQVKARELNSKVLKPINHSYSKLTKTKGKQSEVIVQWLQQFSSGTDVQIAIESLYSNLIYSRHVDYRLFEKSINDIGEFLGFSCQMPDEDEGDGPDNLWRMENGVNLVIEAKNNRTGDRVSREDVGQLLHSIEWHKNKYGNNQPYVPILLHRATKSMEDAHPSTDSRIMDSKLLDDLKSNLTQLGKSLACKSPKSWTVSEVHALLDSNGLTYKHFINKFTIPLR